MEHWTNHRIQISVCWWTLDRSQDRLLDTVDKLNYQLHWSSQIVFIIVSLYVLLRAYQLTVIIIMSTPLGGGHIIFAFSAVRHPTWFPDILGNSSYPIFTKFGMQVYLVIACMGLLLVMIAL